MYKLRSVAHFELLKYQWQFDIIVKSVLPLVFDSIFRNIIVFHDIDKYFILATAPIAFVLQIIIIVAMVKYGMINHPPEDIIFSLIIAEAVACASLFSHAGSKLLR